MYPIFHINRKIYRDNLASLETHRAVIVKGVVDCNFTFFILNSV